VRFSCNRSLAATQCPKCHISAARVLERA
jgi:hypothetical protein